MRSDGLDYLANVVTVGPASEPVTLDEAKAHLRIPLTVTDEDTELTAKIAEAREYAETLARRPFITRTFRLTLDRFPSERRLILPAHPVIAVSSVVYLDAAGASQTFSSGNYSVQSDQLPGRIFLATGADWPTTLSEPGRAIVTVTYTAGYSSAAAVPRRARQAILMILGHWWDGTRETAGEKPLGEHAHAADALLASLQMPVTA